MNVRVVGGVRAKPSVAFISSHKARVAQLICGHNIGGRPLAFGGKFLTKSQPSFLPNA